MVEAHDPASKDLTDTGRTAPVVSAHTVEQEWGGASGWALGAFASFCVSALCGFGGGALLANATHTVGRIYTSEEPDTTKQIMGGILVALSSISGIVFLAIICTVIALSTAASWNGGRQRQRDSRTPRRSV